MLRMPEQEYLDTTLKTLVNRIDGFFDLENNRLKTGWEQTRWQSTLILNTLGSLFGKRFQRIKPTDLVQFPWESTNGIPVHRPGRKLTPEEIQKKFAEYDKKMLKRWQKTG